MPNEQLLENAIAEANEAMYASTEAAARMLGLAQKSQEEAERAVLLAERARGRAEALQALREAQEHSRNLESADDAGGAEQQPADHTDDEDQHVAHQ